MLRVCCRHNLSLPELEALPEWLQIEYLAEDYYIQQMLDTMLEPFRRRIRKDEPIDTASYYQLLIARYAGV